MDKGIGFNRSIFLPWLDATAAFCAETDDPSEIRERLEPVVGQHLKGVEARRKTIDVLINIWFQSREIAPDLRDEAVNWFQTSPVIEDRLWLHYGLTLVYYPFFRECVMAVGQFGRYEGTVTTRIVKRRLAADRGHLGSLDRSVERVIASLRDWGVLAESDERYLYEPQCQVFPASSFELEAWLLTCALHAHPAEELPFADLLHLPELFPFHFTLAVDQLRQHPRFDVRRQGPGWDMVRVVSGGHEMTLKGC
jgi:hypothetical protein